MGVIFRAPTPFPPYRCCKRVLDQADSRETLAHVRREAQAAANLDHPNVLPIHEVSYNEDGLPFFSMKFASLRWSGPCNMRMQGQSSSRDLKPGNIVLDGHGEPWSAISACPSGSIR